MSELQGAMAARGKRDKTELVLSTLVWSLFNCLLLSPVLLWVKGRTLPAWQQVLLRAGVLLIAPIIEAILIARLLGPDRISRIMTFLGFPLQMSPTSWDHVFSRRKPYLIRATLSDGTMVGGLWDARSYASAHPVAEDIYLELLWRLGEHGEFLELVPLSAGTNVKRSEIRMQRPGSTPVKTPPKKP